MVRKPTHILYEVLFSATHNVSNKFPRSNWSGFM